MLYTGGLFSGNNLVAAFADCESAKSLVLGSFLTLLFTFALYLPRKVLKFSECCEGFTSGFKAMVPAIFILCLAWSLSGVCSKEYLNIGGFVSKIVDVETGAAMIIPALFFLVALGLAFATGTSWGTFGILIPITVAVFGDGGEMLVLTVAAVLAGAVCGDHISPISDTTILASAGAECNHIDHVSTQIPYVLCVAACCLIGFLAGGIAQSGIAALITGIIALIIVLWLLMKFANGKEKHSAVDEI